MTGLFKTILGGLTNLFESKSDKCYRCGREGHFAYDCYAKTHVKGYLLNVLIWTCEICNKEFDNKHEAEKHEIKCKNKKKYSCNKCGRIGHYASKCYAKTHIKGYDI